jgi:hypothetical protein
MKLIYPLSCKGLNDISYDKYAIDDKTWHIYYFKPITLHQKVSILYQIIFLVLNDNALIKQATKGELLVGTDK